MRVLKKIGSTEFLLLCGVIGPLLFIVVLLIEGATRPGYSAWRNYGSDLSLSSQGWEQIANFIVTGLLCMAFAVGLQRLWRTGRGSTWGPRLIGLFGLSLVIAGVCVIDPGRGYPPGAALTGGAQSWHGYVHGINGALLFNVILPAACFVLSRRFAADPQSRRWATYCWMTGALLLLVSVLNTLSAPIAENGGYPLPIGLIQRVQIVIGWVWVSLTALRLWRQERAVMAGEAPAGISATSANVE